MIMWNQRYVVLTTLWHLALPMLLKLTTSAPVNNTTTYNNGEKIVPSYLCEPISTDINNYKEILIDSGYYTEEQLK